MSGELLFEVPEQLSPRLAWEREHGIATHDGGDEAWPSRWLAVSLPVACDRIEALGYAVTPPMQALPERKEGAR